MFLKTNIMRSRNMIIRGKMGVTLIEVMVVVAIVGMLAAIAIPAYNNYVTRSRRSDAFTALETVRAAQEMYRAEKGFYASDFVDGGVTVLAGCSATMAGDNYSTSINRTGTTTYSVRAASQNKQAGDFFLGIDHNGSQYTCPGTGACPALDPAAPGGDWQLDSWEDLR
jgi:type IV pilus assembly protein PilE